MAAAQRSTGITAAPCQPRWEHFRHGADIGVRGLGPTMAAAFEQAALAMTAVVTEPSGVRCTTWIDIACTAPSPDLLLYDWLNALVLEMATRRMLFGRFEVAIKGSRLKGRAGGEAVSRERHEPTVEVKGATLTELAVAERPAGQWCAQCIVDV